MRTFRLSSSALKDLAVRSILLKVPYDPEGWPRRPLELPSLCLDPARPIVKASVFLQVCCSQRPPSTVLTRRTAPDP